MWLVDSAFARFWWILRRGLAHYRLGKSLRPRLENPQNHRKILESYGDDSLRGLQSKGLLKKPAAAAPCTASLVFSSQILESCGVGSFGLQSCLESCAVRVARKLTFSVIASGVSRVAIHTKKQGVCNE